MAALHYMLSFILHLDEHLIAFVTAYGTWTYALLFLIIFCETGIVFSAILPGDSLLFAAGALTANVGDILNIHILFLLLVAASVLGNGLNYLIGKWFGSRVFRSSNSWLFNKRNIDNAHGFFERYGGKTIIIARFIPMIRTFAPFVAGIGYMAYRQFLIYSLIGAVLWIGVLVYGSYLFGNIPLVKQHFSLVIAAIIVLSVFPALIAVMRRKFSNVTT
ncbi:MAG: putative rane protein [Gammaproteobacteria bacterium]|jgi:membrane-associated protein|nr:putative rane protein [Gammaproteobacteria bacterium]